VAQNAMDFFDVEDNYTFLTVYESINGRKTLILISLGVLWYSRWGRIN